MQDAKRFIQITISRDDKKYHLFLNFQKKHQTIVYKYKNK